MLPNYVSIGYAGSKTESIANSPTTAADINCSLVLEGVMRSSLQDIFIYGPMFITSFTFSGRNNHPIIPYLTRSNGLSISRSIYLIFAWSFGIQREFRPLATHSLYRCRPHSQVLASLTANNPKKRKNRVSDYFVRMLIGIDCSWKRSGVFST